MEKKERIGYLGPIGSFSWRAAVEIAEKVGKSEEIKLVPFATFMDGGRLLEEGEIERALLPIENSNEGRIGDVIDVLRGLSENFGIEKEIIIPVEQWLLVLSGSKLSEIKIVHSKGPVFSQCKIFLERGEIKRRGEDSTSKAAEIVVGKGERCRGVIGPRWLTQFFPQLEAIAKITDEKDNATRFLLIGNGKNEITGEDKTALIFTVQNRPGELARVLNIFGSLGINMVMLEERPSKTKQLGDYEFYVEIKGHREERKIKVALEAIEIIAEFFKILGSFPKHSS